DQHYEIYASAFKASSARSESPPETSTSFLASCASAPNGIYRENIVSKAPDLKPIYRGGTVEDAEQRLTPFGAKWDATYPTVSRKPQKMIVGDTLSNRRHWFLGG
ncbi:MAG: hypothetical protein M3Y07_01780, partial [Acidobacteriota bacterium]|nr:hypothetical protein [Acidobacteriota bacterium]